MKKETTDDDDFNAGERKNFFVHETEEYSCGNCGESVIGGRYNNHCPHCLWSKHLDEKIPGDRASECKALMEPVGVVQKGGAWRIIHHCTVCNKYGVVDSVPEDNFDLIVELSQKPIPTDFT